MGRERPPNSRGRVNPAAAPGVAHAPCVRVNVVVRTKPNPLPRTVPERAPYPRHFRSKSRDLGRAEFHPTTGVQTCEWASAERVPS
jgi:hypothetical protein